MAGPIDKPLPRVLATSIKYFVPRWKVFPRTWTREAARMERARVHLYVRAGATAMPMNKSRPVVKKSWRTESLFIQTFMTFPHDSAALAPPFPSFLFLQSCLPSRLFSPCFVSLSNDSIRTSSRANDHPALSNDRDVMLVNARKLLIFLVTVE